VRSHYCGWAECLDEDIREALFGAAEDFEELDDNFVLQAAEVGLPELDSISLGGVLVGLAL
jgi:hypothetical protein